MLGPAWQTSIEQVDLGRSCFELNDELGRCQQRYWNRHHHRPLVLVPILTFCHAVCAVKTEDETSKYPTGFNDPHQDGYPNSASFRSSISQPRLGPRSGSVVERDREGGVVYLDVSQPDLVPVATDRDQDGERSAERKQQDDILSTADSTATSTTPTASSKPSSHHFYPPSLPHLLPLASTVATIETKLEAAHIRGPFSYLLPVVALLIPLCILILLVTCCTRNRRALAAAAAAAAATAAATAAANADGNPDQAGVASSPSPSCRSRSRQAMKADKNAAGGAAQKRSRGKGKGKIERGGEGNGCVTVDSSKATTQLDLESGQNHSTAISRTDPSATDTDPGGVFTYLLNRFLIRSEERERGKIRDGPKDLQGYGSRVSFHAFSFPNRGVEGPREGSETAIGSTILSYRRPKPQSALISPMQTIDEDQGEGRVRSGAFENRSEYRGRDGSDGGGDGDGCRAGKTISQYTPPILPPPGSTDHGSVSTLSHLSTAEGRFPMILIQREENESQLTVQTQTDAASNDTDTEHDRVMCARATAMHQLDPATPTTDTAFDHHSGEDRSLHPSPDSPIPMSFPSIVYPTTAAHTHLSLPTSMFEGIDIMIGDLEDIDLDPDFQAISRSTEERTKEMGSMKPGVGVVHPQEPELLLVDATEKGRERQRAISLLLPTVYVPQPRSEPTSPAK